MTLEYRQQDSKSAHNFYSGLALGIRIGYKIGTAAPGSVLAKPDTCYVALHVEDDEDDNEEVLDRSGSLELGQSVLSAGKQESQAVSAVTSDADFGFRGAAARRLVPQDDLAKLDSELAAFDALKPTVLRKYLGLFVAIHQGEVIDSDEDEFELVARIEDIARREGPIAVCRASDDRNSGKGQTDSEDYDSPFFAGPDE